MLPGISILLSIAWKGAVILCLAHLLAALMRSRSAAERHLVWVAAMVSLLALPALEHSAPAVVILESAPVAAAPAVPIEAPSKPPAEPRTDYRPHLWIAGCAIVAAYPLLGLLGLAFRRRRRTPFDDAQSCAEALGGHRVRVYTAPSASLPMTWGLLRPVIVLPESARQWAPERLRVVLMHELAHVERLDFLTQFLGAIARAAFWYNPLVWTAVAQMRKERERACDDAVLRYGERPSDYAQHLLEIAAGGRRGIPAVAVPMAHHSHLESRIRSALNPRLARRTPHTTMKIAFTVLSTLALLTLVVIKTQAQANTGRLTGSVLDPSGAAVPKATVIVTLDGSGRKEITTSGEDGVYNFAALPEGKYSVEVRKPGFAALIMPAVFVKGANPQSVDLRLAMGKVQESLDIVGTKGIRQPPPASSGAPRRIRVGGNVQALKIIKMVRPVYPEHLQLQGIEGTVLLEGVISMKGEPISLRSLNSLVHPELTKAAMDAVNQWQYQPTLLNGQPVEIITTITVNYRLAQ